MSDTSETTLDLYKLAVEMADRVSARRGGANQFYLTLETLILAVPAAFELGDGGKGADAQSPSASPSWASLLQLCGGSSYACTGLPIALSSR